jgi:release factor glutamine methyltransferase
MRPRARVYATDVDPNCIELAQRNAARLGVEIELIESNWFDRVPDTSRFDLIVSNPPYIAANHPFLRQGDLPAEPGLALSPGDTGLEALGIIIGDAPKFLSPGGYMVVEHGYDQQAAVTALFHEHGFADIFCADDLNGLPRTTRAKLVEKGRDPA